MSRTPYLDLNIPDKSSKGFVVTDVFEPNFTKLDQEAERVNLRKMSTEDNIEELKKTNRYKLGDVVEVLGFHAKGDGSHHKRVAKAEDDGSGEQGQNGIWWCVVHNGEVNVSWFGTNNQSCLKSAIEYCDTVVVDKDLSITSEISLSANNKSVKGISKNVITFGTGNGLRIEGNNNSIENLIIKKENKETGEGRVDFTSFLLSLLGDNISIKKVETLNFAGFGMQVGGRNIVISECYSHDNVVGLQCTEKTRNLHIMDSEFSNNNILQEPISGADGILFTRSCLDIKLTNVKLNGNSEHGFYFQGQGIIVENCEANNNTHTGFKFGSHADNLYEYYSGELELWVDNHYGGKDVIISNCKATGNKDGIYFQPSWKNVSIKNSSTIKNSENGVYFGFFNSPTLYEDLKDINIYNLISEENGTRGLYLNISENAVIENSNVDIINTYSKNTATLPITDGKAKNIKILNSNTNSIILVRTKESKIENTIISALLSVASHCSDIFLFGNDIKTLEELDLTTFNEIINNVFEFNGTSFKNFKYSSGIINVTLKILDNNFIQKDSSQPFGFYFTDTDLASYYNFEKSLISRNTFECSNTRGVIMSASNSIVNSNNIQGITQDVALKIKGVKNNITCNNADKGTFWIVSGESSNVVGLNSQNTLVTLEEPQTGEVI